MGRIAAIEQQLEPLREELRNHRLYGLLSDVSDIQSFMESHVYAVWDFMSLLKALQEALTCTSLPWKTPKNPAIARFINEIVWGEESDVNYKGEPQSHFDMYLESMTEVGASAELILKMINNVESVDDLLAYIHNNPLPDGVKAFLEFTFTTIRDGDTHKIASAFTFGREDLIPDMFLSIINDPNGKTTAYPKIKYYLERHIEVDGDGHGPLALNMIQLLCGDDDQKWEEVLSCAVEALKLRIHLWDCIASGLEIKRANEALTSDLTEAVFS